MDRDRIAQRPVSSEASKAPSGSIVISLFLAVMLQWAAVLVVCPSVHELIHHDADGEHHDCAVTLFLAGQVEQAFIDPVILSEPVPVEVPFQLIRDALISGSFFLSCRILEHAPPRQK
jgi:hypothetical protein